MRSTFTVKATQGGSDPALLHKAVLKYPQWPPAGNEELLASFDNIAPLDLAQIRVLFQSHDKAPVITISVHAVNDDADKETALPGFYADVKMVLIDSGSGEEEEEEQAEIGDAPFLSMQQSRVVLGEDTALLWTGSKWGKPRPKGTVTVVVSLLLTARKEAKELLAMMRIEELSRSSSRSSRSSSSTSSSKEEVNSFLQELDEGFLSDVELRFGEGNILKPNSYFLRRHSTVFNAMLGSPFKETQERVILLQGDDPEAVRSLVKFCYCNKAQISGWQQAVQLLLLADKYGVASLAAQMEVELAKRITVDSAFAIFNVLDLLNKDDGRVSRFLRLYFSEAAIKSGLSSDEEESLVAKLRLRFGKEDPEFQLYPFKRAGGN